MTQYSINERTAQQYFESLFQSEKELKDNTPLSNAKNNEVIQIMSLFDSAKGQEIATAKNTLWGAVNAVSNYVDFVKSSKTVDRIDSAWFGVGAALKEKAWDNAIELAKIE